MVSAPSAKAMSVAMALPSRAGRCRRRCQQIDQRRDDHAPHRRRDRQSGLARDESSPARISRLISRPTRRKKIAISPSLIH